jgi:hypothetical protein
LLGSLRRGDVAFIQAVKSDWVIAEHFAFELVGDVLARF